MGARRNTFGPCIRDAQCATQGSQIGVIADYSICTARALNNTMRTVKGRWSCSSLPPAFSAYKYPFFSRSKPSSVYTIYHLTHEILLQNKDFHTSLSYIQDYFCSLGLLKEDFELSEPSYRSANNMAEQVAPENLHFSDIVLTIRTFYGNLDLVSIVEPEPEKYSRWISVNRRDDATLADVLLFRFEATEADPAHEAWQVLNTFDWIRQNPHPNISQILDSAMFSRSLIPNMANNAPRGLGYCYAIQGYDLMTNSLLEVYERAWPVAVPEPFIWHVYKSVVDALAYLHKGCRLPSEADNPQAAVALCARDLLGNTHIQLKQMTGTNNPSRSAYGRIMLSDFSRCRTPATFVPCTLNDSDLTYDLVNFEDAKKRDIMALGELLHWLKCQQELNQFQECKCRTGAIPHKYSTKLTWWAREAAFGLQSAEQLANGIASIAQDSISSQPELLMSPEVLNKFAEQATEFPDLLAIARASGAFDPLPNQ